MTSVAAQPEISNLVSFPAPPSPELQLQLQLSLALNTIVSDLGQTHHLMVEPANARVLATLALKTFVGRACECDPNLTVRELWNVLESGRR